MNSRIYLSLLLFSFLSVVGCKENKSEENQETSLDIREKGEPQLIAEVPNLTHCESVAYDSKRELLYVSVQGENEDGDGSIAKVDLEGNLLDTEFIAGLDNPKGIAVYSDKLYVSDVTDLVEIDLSKGVISKKYTHPDAEFLNDVAVDMKGNVYVSDMFTSSVYILSPDGNFDLWHSSAEMENPNGLLVVGNELYLGSWGRFSDKNPGNAPKGSFKRINLETKKVTPVTKEVIGNLDGVQVYKEGSFLLSDWISGGILKVTEEGDVEHFMETDPSVGDILYLPGQQLLALPMNKSSRLLLFQL